jgi:glycosyltransferase involved in cell wall biosynthesis
VDVARFAPRGAKANADATRTLAARLRASAAGQAPRVGASAFTREELAAAEALERLDADGDALVAFVGKLIVSKGVDLLLAAFPLVLEQAPHARLVVVGFGAYREGLERLMAALASGDLDQARQIALAGRSLEDPGSEARPLRHLLAFLDGLLGEERERYLAAARALSERVVLTGRLEHDELAQLLPACEALVVPSTFPEAFGMVAAEAAACGVLPVSAAHSGLAEVTDALARAVPEQAVPWLSFPIDDAAIRAISVRLCGWLGADSALRSRTRAGLVATARERWSWEGVAGGVITAARGELEALQEP